MKTRYAWKVNLLDSTMNLIDNRGDPSDEPMWASLQVAFDSLSWPTIDPTKHVLDHHAALLTNILAEKRSVRTKKKRALKNGQKGTNSPRQVA